WTLAEDYNIDEDDVSKFLDTLEWHDHPLELRYPDRRPIQFWVHTEPASVREQIAALDEIDLVIPDAVREHLQSVRAIVAMEMAFTQLETMFELVAFEIAYWLAETCAGVILGPNDRWYDHGAHRWQPFEVETGV